MDWWWCRYGSASCSDHAHDQNAPHTRPRAPLLPVADAQGVKYYEGFAVNCIRDTYLKDHDAPEDCEYYLCGPPMLIKTVTDYLDSLGVDPESIMYDNFG